MTWWKAFYCHVQHFRKLRHFISEKKRHRQQGCLPPAFLPDLTQRPGSILRTFCMWGREMCSSTCEWHLWKIIRVACRGRVAIFLQEHPWAGVPVPHPASQHPCRFGLSYRVLRGKEEELKSAHWSLECFSILDEVYSDNQISVLLYEDHALYPVRNASPSKELRISVSI